MPHHPCTTLDYRESQRENAMRDEANGTLQFRAVQQQREMRRRADGKERLASPHFNTKTAGLGIPGEEDMETDGGMVENVASWRTTYNDDYNHALPPVTGKMQLTTSKLPGSPTPLAGLKETTLFDAASMVIYPALPRHPPQFRPSCLEL